MARYGLSPPIESPESQAEANLRALIESTNDLIFSVDLTFALITFNQALFDNIERNYGVRAAVGMHADELLPPERAALWPALCERALSEGPFRVEYSLTDGRTLELAFNPIIQNGQATGISLFGKDITERKAKERALREAERKYRNIFENAPYGIFQASPEGRLFAANPALARMLGYGSADELLSATGMVGEAWVRCDDRLRYLQVLQEQGEVREFECLLRRRDGREILASISSRQVPGVDGRILYHEGVVEDITGRKRTLEALRRSEERFSKAFRSNPAVLTLADISEHPRLIDVNEAFEAVTGYRRAEAIGRTVKELGLFVDPRRCDEAVELIKATGRLRNFEYQLYRKSGEISIGVMSAEAIEIDGKLCAIAATLDITGLKQAEREMRNLITAIEQSADTIVITGADGTIQYCNPAFEKTTRYSKEEAIGQNVRVLNSEKQDAESYERLWASITEGNVWTGILITRRKDASSFEANAAISPIRDKAGRITGFVAVSRDITNQRQLEEQLRQAQKLESIGRLAGGVAHDFNNLLTVMNGYSEFLLTLLKPSDPLRLYAEEIRKAGERAAGLTRELLAFSRKQVIEPRVLDLNTTIRESVPMLKSLIGEDIALAAHLDAFLGQVMADPSQIHQVIMNLVVNARDAMPDGGSLDIGTANVELGEAVVAAIHADMKPGRYVVMTVTDTGYGMDEATRCQIFEPFFTTKEKGKGTGLGLPTVYGIVRQSGGWIDVWSEPGAGTWFKVYLPRIDGAPVPERIQATVRAEGGGETVLVVEDQPAIRSFINAVLKEYGYRVLDASDGEEAVGVAKGHSGEIDLLLTDVVLPNMNGRVLAEKLRAMRPNVKVLFTSGYTDEAIAKRGVLAHGVAYIPKPFGSDELAAKVRDVLN